MESGSSALPTNRVDKSSAALLTEAPRKLSFYADFEGFMRRNDNPGKKKCNRVYDLCHLATDVSKIENYITKNNLYYLVIDSLVYGYDDAIVSYFDEYYDDCQPGLKTIETINKALTVFLDAVQELKRFYGPILAAADHAAFMDDYAIDQVLVYERENTLVIRYEEI